MILLLILIIILLIASDQKGKIMSRIMIKSRR
jgi:hypothetical protein